MSENPSTLLALVDALDDLIHNAKPVPLTPQVRVDSSEVYVILDRIREVVPEVLSGVRPGLEPAADPVPPATQVELAEAVQTLTDLVERVKFGGERFRIDAHGMPMAELGPVAD